MTSLNFSQFRFVAQTGTKVQRNATSLSKVGTFNCTTLLLLFTNWIRSETELKTVQQLAPALFVYVTNTTNFTFAFSVKEKVVPAKDGMYICALLRLQPTNHSRNWDVDSCSVKQLFKSATYECQCPQAGTALLLYATKVPKVIVTRYLNQIQLALHQQEAPEVSPDLWVLIWFAAASSLLVLIICLGTLTTRWYRHRTLWGWFKMQLGIALFPISMSHFLPPRVIVSFSQVPPENSLT